MIVKETSKKDKWHFISECSKESSYSEWNWDEIILTFLGLFRESLTDAIPDGFHFARDIIQMNDRYYIRWNPSSDVNYILEEQEGPQTKCFALNV